MYSHSAEVRFKFTRPMFVMAHPDDEAVACGVLLQRCLDPVLVFATDGSPRDPMFWKSHGSRHRYAAVRRFEAIEAARRAGVKRVEFLARIGVPDEFVDQELHRHLREGIKRLSDLIEQHGSQCLVTLAYEGGHPDHDSCSFMTSILAKRFGLPAFEVPLYHRNLQGRFVRQEFMTRSGTEATISSWPEELQRKREMIACYASHQAHLTEFNWSVEAVRPMEQYDYQRPPHEGVLHYEHLGWKMSGSRLSSIFSRSRDNRMAAIA
jgi:N-acetylglucosamine malate deacetylase 2